MYATFNLIYIFVCLFIISLCVIHCTLLFLTSCDHVSFSPSSHILSLTVSFFNFYLSPTDCKWSRLYGILHAILLLLAGRVASAQHPRNTLTGHEMLFLIFSRETRFTVLYGLLIDALEIFASHELPLPLSLALPTSSSESMPIVCNSSYRSSGMMDVSSTDILPTENDSKSIMRGVRVDSDRSWMGPAILILDIMSQSLLVDKGVLKVRTF